MRVFDLKTYAQNITNFYFGTKNVLKLLFKIVKLGFQQRRKTLRNSLKILNIPEMFREDSIFDKRPEMLSGKDFVQLAKKIGHGNISN